MATYSLGVLPVPVRDQGTNYPYPILKKTSAGVVVIGRETFMNVYVNLSRIAEAWQLHQAGALSIDEFTELKKSLLKPEVAPPLPVAPTPSHGDSSTTDHEALASEVSGFFASLSSVLNV